MENLILTEAGAVSAAAIDPNLNARLVNLAKGAILPYQSSLNKNYYNRLYMNVLNVLRSSALQGVLTNALDDATLSKQVNATAKSMANQMLLNQQKAMAAQQAQPTTEEAQPAEAQPQPVAETQPVEQAAPEESANAPAEQAQQQAQQPQGQQLSNSGSFTTDEIKSVQGLISGVVGKLDPHIEQEINTLPGYKDAGRSVDIKFGKLLSESSSNSSIVAYKEAFRRLNELPIEITFDVSLGDAKAAEQAQPEQTTEEKPAEEQNTEETEKKEESQDRALENALNFIKELREAEAAPAVASNETMLAALKQIQTSLVANLGVRNIKIGDKKYQIKFEPGKICQATDPTHGTFSVKIQKTAELITGKEVLGAAKTAYNFLKNRRADKLAYKTAKQQTKLAKQQAKNDAMYAKAALVAAKKGQKSVKKYK